jgi:hypothetical protein
MVMFWCFVASFCGGSLTMYAKLRWGWVAETAVLMVVSATLGATGIPSALFAVFGLLIGYGVARLVWIR